MARIGKSWQAGLGGARWCEVGNGMAWSGRRAMAALGTAGHDWQARLGSLVAAGQVMNERRIGVKVRF